MKFICARDYAVHQISPQFCGCPLKAWDHCSWIGATDVSDGLDWHLGLGLPGSCHYQARTGDETVEGSGRNFISEWKCILTGSAELCLGFLGSMHSHSCIWGWPKTSVTSTHLLYNISFLSPWTVNDCTQLLSYKAAEVLAPLSVYLKKKKVMDLFSLRRRALTVS